MRLGGTNFHRIPVCTFFGFDAKSHTSTFLKSVIDMGNASSIADHATGISPEAFEALRNEYELQKKAEPVLTGNHILINSLMLMC